MVFNLEHKVETKDILFPRTLVVEELGMLAVFRSSDDCTILLAEAQPDGETSIMLGANITGLDKAVGSRLIGVIDMNDKVNKKYDWKHAAEEGLIWNIKHGIVGWQNGDEVTIVDSVASNNPLLGETVAVDEYDWTTVIEFAKSITSSIKILAKPISHDEVVIFDKKEELVDYLEMVTGKFPRTAEEVYASPLFPDDMTMEFPMVQSEFYAFPLSNTKALITKKTALSKLMPFSEWKKSRE